MSERVVQSGLNIEWEANAPEAVLVSNDLARTVLAARAHFDDADQRNVVLVWNGVEAAIFGGPNDEAISGHRLWHSGLSEILWLGVVEDSALRASLEAQNSVHPRHDRARFRRVPWSGGV